MLPKDREKTDSGIVSRVASLLGGRSEVILPGECRTCIVWTDKTSPDTQAEYTALQEKLSTMYKQLMKIPYFGPAETSPTMAAATRALDFASIGDRKIYVADEEHLPEGVSEEVQSNIELAWMATDIRRLMNLSSRMSPSSENEMNPQRQVRRLVVDEDMMSRMESELSTLRYSPRVAMKPVVGFE